MKWLLYGLVGLTAAIVAGLFAVPSLINWDAYRPKIAQQIYAATGFEVELKGPISATILPTPRLILTQIEIRDPDGPIPRAKIRWVGADASLPALLQGHVRITDITVVEPVFHSAGFVVPDINNETATESGTVQPQSSGLTVSSYHLDGQLRVEDGSIIWSNGDSSTKVSGTIMVDGPTGRWTGELAAFHRETPFDISFRVGSSGAPSGTRVQATLAPGNAKATMDIAGNLAFSKSDGLAFEGDIVANIDEPSATLEPWLPQLAPVLASSGSIRIETRARVSEKLIDLQAIQFESPGGSGNGYVTIDYEESGRADINLKFNRLNVDALRRQAASGEQLSGTGQELEGVQPASAIVPNDETRLFQAFGATGMDARIDISVAAIQLKGSLIRNAVLRATSEGGSVTLEEFAALLPGGSSVSLAGFGVIDSPSSAFEGNMSVQADDLRRLMNWAGLQVPKVAADRLRSLDFISGIKYAANRLDLVDARVVIDGIEADVSAAIALRERPGIGLRVSIERLNLDAYRVMNEQTESAETASGNSGLVLEGVPQSSTGEIENTAPPFDAIVDLKVQQLIFGSVPVKALTGRLEYRNGVLRSDALTFADAGGLAGTAMGEFDIGSPDMPGTATIRGHGEDIGALAAILGASDTIATRVRSFGESDIMAVYERDYTAQHLGFQIDGVSGRASADMAWNPLGNTIEVTVTNGSMTLGLLDARNVSFAAVSQVTGDIRVVDINGKLNGGALSGELKASKTETGWTGQGRVGVSNVPVDAFLDGLRGTIRTKGSLSIEADVTIDETRTLTNESTLMVDGVVSGSAGLRVTDNSGSKIRIARIERVKEILTRSFSTKPQPVQGVFSATDRALTTRGITITSSDGAQINLFGQVDFSTQSVNAEVQVSDSAETNEKLTISGAMDRPSLRLSN